MYSVDPCKLVVSPLLLLIQLYVFALIAILESH